MFFMRCAAGGAARAVKTVRKETSHCGKLSSVRGPLAQGTEPIGRATNVAMHRIARRTIAAASGARHHFAGSALT
jgi:hypothetical protein